jgi:bifunctional non-homologous end joining protein LigD
MAKRADSLYVSPGRTTEWLKIKTSTRQEVVIAGFTAPRRARPFFGALSLAVREKKGWRYIGHVGTGLHPVGLGRGLIEPRSGTSRLLSKRTYPDTPKSKRMTRS